MKQAIRVRGWISTANLINPRKLFTDELPRYYLAIQPEDPIVFDELQEQVDQRKLEAETPYSSTESVADEIFDGCEVIFQTTIEPRLENGLMIYIKSLDSSSCKSSKNPRNSQHLPYNHANNTEKY